MAEGGLPQLDDEGNRGGATWLHFAALVGKCDIVDEIRLLTNPPWEECIKAQTRARVTPLHIAARMGHHQMILDLLGYLAGKSPDSSEELQLNELVKKPENQAKGEAVLQAIIQETENEDNLISLAVAKSMQTHSLAHTGNSKATFENQGYQNIESLETVLWKTLITVINQHQNGFFSFPHTENAELVVKTLIWRGNMSNNSTWSLDCLDDLRKKLEILDHPKGNLLDWAVSHRYPVAVYWLLSSGLYFSEHQVQDCESYTDTQIQSREVTKLEKRRAELLSTTENPEGSTVQAERIKEIGKEIGENKEGIRIKEHIKKLLRSPPPVRARKGDTESPHFQGLINSCDKQEGTVLDLCLVENKIIPKHTRETIFNIIDEGPELLMRRNKEPTYADFKAALFPNSSPEEKAPERGARNKNQRQERAEPRLLQKRIRWVHIPVNNVSIQGLILSTGRASASIDSIFSELC
ncbi:Mg2+ transporter protein CorA-like/Zinc transport protein ZntB [Penicillium malachiteum]|uniref:Mg2+ transporter protein CorA-like/Zinc transport protein ZntB n=1 Tax=Penicillium malachiteum TaxID=1324776 RepID=UPI0025472593|nr:Mg2+ transporter protein CorA-like/Zinc transport protein ZntB [Penicillium malachiteum]KAJ5725863.1 Mg2+ transporter protein CorA-like/Zinc transport protein ZntB [Penicillium malachiteum]